MNRRASFVTSLLFIGCLGCVAACHREQKPVASPEPPPGEVLTQKNESGPVKATVTLDTSKAGWLSTGLYAPPGAKITVELPALAASAALSIRIGCHTDGLWHLGEWRRVPEISRSLPVSIHS